MNTIRDLFLRIVELFVSFEQFHFDALNAINRFIQREFHFNVWHIRAILGVFVFIATIVELPNNIDIALARARGVLLAMFFIFVLVCFSVAEEEENSSRPVTFFKSVDAEEFDNVNLVIWAYRIAVLIANYINLIGLILGYGNPKAPLMDAALYCVSCSFYFDNIDKGERSRRLEDQFSRQES